MSDLFNTLLKLTSEGKDRVVVVDSLGQAIFVVYPADHNQPNRQEKLRQLQLDVEAINKKILQAQLEESEDSSGRSIIKTGIVNPPKSVNFGSSVVRSGQALPDLREEVIDPTFDFDPPIEH